MRNLARQKPLDTRLENHRGYRAMSLAADDIEEGVWWRMGTNICPAGLRLM